MNQRPIRPCFDSHELLEEFPFLFKDPFWKPFNKIFDSDEPKEQREHVYSISRGEDPTVEKNHDDKSNEQILSDLKKYSLVLSSPLFTKLLRKNLSKEYAGEILGKHFLQLLKSEEYSKNFTKMLQKFHKKVTLLRGYKVQIALLFFIYRERRLPSKDELKVETWHYEQAQHVQLNTSDSEVDYASILEQKRVYKFYSDIEGDSALLIDEHIWNEPSIEKSHWSTDIIKKFGFSGLPRKNQLKLG